MTATTHRAAVEAMARANDPETFWSDYVQAAELDQDDSDDGADCGLGSDGQCANAGTEWCDWDCGRLG